MGGRVIQLRGSEIGAADMDGRTLSVRFAPALVLRSEGVPGVDVSTLWAQVALLCFQDGEIDGEFPSFPARLAGGTITVNRLSYVDMIPAPLDSAGYIRLVLNFVGATPDLTIVGTSATLELLEHGKYLQHLPPA